VDDSPLGRRTEYPDRYAPELLFAIPREEGRRAIGIRGSELPFGGVDIWNAYEISWLDPKGKPVVAVGELRFPATSPKIVESKSLKLYLHSLSGTSQASDHEVAQLIVQDLGRVTQAPVAVRLALSQDESVERQVPLFGTCIDGLDVEILTYEPDPSLLANSTEEGTVVHETLHSHLLKSKCPVTDQPDLGNVLVRYRGDRIDPRALLRYVVSFRNHAALHEQCAERMFVEIKESCRPSELTVYARYTRRGGLDINPFRSDHETAPANARRWRQ
jgi:7-cyano-7-deazaguanine reductase